MKYLSSLLFLLISLISCNSQEVQTVEEETSVVKEVVEQDVEVLTPAPKAYLSSLQARANGIEATMYSAGASFSVFDPNSVYAFTTLITPNPPKSLSKNQVGHIMFLMDGESILLSHVFNNGSDVYMAIDDEETGEKYYNVLQGKAKDLFTNVKVSTPE